MLAHLNLRPSTKQLRQFGWIALVAFAVVGFVVLWKGGLFGASFASAARPIAYVLWALGLLSGLFSLVWPKANQPLFVFLGLITFRIGFVLSHIVLAILFFGVLTPVAFLFRLLGRDPLQRKWEPERGSYWDDLPEVIEKRDYFRQF